MCTEEASMSIKLLQTMHIKTLSTNPNFKMQKHSLLFQRPITIPTQYVHTCNERITFTASNNCPISNGSPTVSNGSLDNNRTACTREIHNKSARITSILS